LFINIQKNIKLGEIKMAKGKAIMTSQKILIANLHLKNMSYGEIANEMNLSKQTIYRCIRKDKETKEMVEQLNQKYKDEIFNTCIKHMADSFMENSQEKGDLAMIKIDGKTTLEMRVEGYNK